jgi:hypothetical protein
VKIWKKVTQRWLQFSLLVAPLKKMREVFVRQLVLRKILSRIFKIYLHLPRICFERRHSEIGKNGEKGKSGFIFGKAVFRSSPEVVSGFRGWGGSAGIRS